MTAVRAYVRVSSARQVEEGFSLDAQEAQLRSAAPDGDFVVYREQGVSGRKTSRPALDRLMAEIEPGDTIMVVALDRFGRSATNVATNVRLIGEIGAQFVSLRESIDTTTAAGRFFFTIMAALAELESELIGERVKATRPAAKRKHGRSVGGLRPLGREPDLSLRHSEVQTIGAIAARFLDGVPVREIARDLQAAGVPTANGGIWRGPGVTRMLKRPDLCGLVEIDGELEQGSLEPIIERETWERVQALFASRATGVDARGRHPAAPYVLDGLDVRCRLCGGRIRPRTVHRRGRPTLHRYVCVEHEDRATCSMPRIPRDVIDSCIVGMFRTNLLDEEKTLRAIEKATRAALCDTERALRDAEREANLADERLTRIRRDYADGKLSADEWRGFADEIEEGRSACLAEVERLSTRASQLEDEQPVLAAQQALLELLERLRRLAERYSDASEDPHLIRSISQAMSGLIERIIILPRDLPEGTPERVDPHDGSRSVFIPIGAFWVEIVAKESAPTPVESADGSLAYAEMASFERAALPWTDNGRIASMI